MPTGHYKQKAATNGTGGNAQPNQRLMFKHGNYLKISEPYINQDQYVPQTTYLVPTIEKWHPTKYPIDVITLYEDGTCDVFAKALKLETIKYTQSKLHHFKLNKDF